MDRRTKLGFGRSLKFVPRLTADAGWGGVGWLGEGATQPIFHIFCSVVNFSPTSLGFLGSGFLSFYLQVIDLQTA